MSRIVCILLAISAVAVHAQRGFTLEQVLSAPYATNLTAAPTGDLFAWVEHTEGRNNLWIGGPKTPARQLTHNTDDDGLDITQLAWSSHADAITYAYGAPNGAAGKAANPAHLQRDTRMHIFVQSLAANMNSEGASPVDLGEGHAPLFRHDGKSLLFLRAGQIWSAPTSQDQDRGHSAAQLIIDRGSASDLALSPDDNTLAYISHRQEEGHPGHSYLALFDLKSSALSFPAVSTGNDSAPVFSSDGSQLAWLRAPFTEAPEFALNCVAAVSWSIQVMDLATHTMRKAFSPAANKPGSVLPRMSTGEPRLFWTVDRRIVFSSEADGWNHLYEIDPKTTQSPRLLTPGEFEVEDPVVSSDGRTLVYAANNTMADPLHPSVEDADRRHLWGLDLTQAEPRPVFLTQGEGIEEHPALSANGGTLAALVADVRTPMHAALITANGEMRPLHTGAIPAGYPAVNLVVPQRVIFRASDGLSLHGQVFVPREDADSSATLRNDKETKRNDRSTLRNDKTALRKDQETKRPALIFFHGGPRRQMLLGYPAMDYYSNAYAFNQYLVSRGFIVLSVNYRCGIGYGLEFRRCAHGGADGAAEYADVLAAQKYLASRPDVDAKRIGLWGGSYGGYLTALGLARNSDLFAAGVDFHGVHDWRLEENAGDWLRGSNAEKDAIAARAFASSPLADVAKWRSPVLLIHGDDDPDVAYAQTPVLAEALRARNVPVETLIFPDEVHGFLLHRDWRAAYEAGAAFLERVMKP